MSDQVISKSSKVISDYAGSLDGSVCLPDQVLFPSTFHELHGIVAEAKEKLLELHVVCTGRNWGYGSAQGTGEGQTIVDLSRMNKILEVNEDLAYARIQPGVTQGMLAEYLAKHNSRLQLDVTGAPAHTSIVGNFLERGFGHTDYGNRYESILSLKVLLANGKNIATGFGCFKENRNVFDQGIGPDLKGLFSQSNFGIVHEMTIALQPKPAHFCMLILSVKNKDDLGVLVDLVRELRLKQYVNSTIHIANPGRVTNRDTKQLGAWVLSGAISSSKAIVRARKKTIRRICKRRLSRYKLVFVDDAKFRLIKFIHRRIRPLAIFENLKSAIDLQKGNPTDQPLKVMTDLEEVEHIRFADDFATKFRWINACCNAEKTSIEKMMQLLSEIYEKYQYPLQLTLTSINARTLILIANVRYVDDPDAIKKANTFYVECAQALHENQFYAYRTGIRCGVPYDDDYKEVLGNLKECFDPQRVFSPNKNSIN